MPEETTMDDLGAIKGSPWAPSGVLRDVLPDVPRPILSPDEPPFVPAEERPVPSNMKISKKFGYTPGCAKCRKLFRNCQIQLCIPACNVTFQFYKIVPTSYDEYTALVKSGNVASKHVNGWRVRLKRQV